MLLVSCSQNTALEISCKRGRGDTFLIDVKNIGEGEINGSITIEPYKIEHENGIFTQENKFFRLTEHDDLDRKIFHIDSRTKDFVIKVFYWDGTKTVEVDTFQQDCS